MSNQYGPALLLGVLIGGAILLDDVIAPRPPLPDLHRIHARHMEAMAPAQGENVFVFRGDDTEAPVSGEAHEMHWVMKSDGAFGDTEHMRVVEVSVVGDEQAEPSALAAAIRAAVDSARDAGREPTEDEINAAIQSVVGETDGMNIHIELDTTPSP
jgi:hypothetical protein